MSLQNGVASSLRKNANEHAIGAPGCAAAERQPTLPDAETSGESEAVGAFAESAGRSGWSAISAGRRDGRERMDDALRARIALEYSICDVRDQRCAARVAPEACQRMYALTEPAETKAVGEALELEHSTIPRGGCIGRHHLLEPHGLRMGVVEAMYKLPIRPTYTSP